MFFHRLMTGLLLFYALGANIDAREHIHHGFAIESFFSPFHFVMYAGWFSVGVALAACAALQFRRGKPRSEWLPPGYWASAVGFAIFGSGGGFDIVWHEIFGFEANMEAPLSPAHMVLIAGSVFMYLGVLLHSLHVRGESPHRFIATVNGYNLPMILSISLILQSTLWPTWYYDPFVVDYASGGIVAGQFDAFSFIEFGTAAAEVAGVSGILLLSLATTPFLILPLYLWRLPLGTVAIVFGYFYASRMFSAGTYIYLPAVIGASVVAELLWFGIRRRGEGGLSNRTGYRLMALLFPLVLYSIYFTIIATRANGIVWSPHIWVGALAYAGIAGIMMSFVALRPAFYHVRVGLPDA